LRDKISRKKDGSKLSHTELRTFAIILESPSEYLGDMSSGFDESKISPCCELVKEYSIQNRKDYEKGVVNENNLQRRSFELLKSLFFVVLPQYFDKFRFCRKEKGHSETKYTTSLVVDDTEVIVSGETDIAVYYKMVCVYSWEDKNLDKTLTTHQERGQVVSEVKAFAEEFKSKISVEDNFIFCGVITSGLSWSFCNRRFLLGCARYILTEPILIEVKKNKKMSYDVDSISLNIATKILIETVMKVEHLIKIINHSSIMVRTIITENDEDDELGKDPDDGFDEEEEENLSRYLSQTKLNSGVSDKVGRDTKNAETQSKEKEKKTQSHRRPLMQINPNSCSLTADNLKIHNILTSSKSAFTS
jgi:hypothetical protein